MRTMHLEFIDSDEKTRHYLVRLNPDLFILHGDDTPEEIIATHLLDKRCYPNDALREVAGQGLTGPVSVIFPGAVSIIGVDMRVNGRHETDLIYNYKNYSMTIDGIEFSTFRPEICEARRNLKPGPHRGHPLEDGMSLYNSEREEAQLLEEGVGFILGIHEAIGIERSDRFTGTLLFCLATFASSWEHFTNDRREFWNYVSVWGTRIKDLRHNLCKQGALIGENALKPQRLVPGPRIQGFLDMSRPQDIELGLQMGKIATEHSESMIALATAEFAKEINLNIKSDVEKSLPREELSQHQRMEVRAIKRKLLALKPVEVAA